jgi:predicted O-methyltransferase YrrM
MSRRLLPRPSSVIRSWRERRALEDSVRRLPPRAAAFADRFRHGLRDPYGTGPLNGQPERQRVVRELIERLGIAGIIETGTYRGTSTEWFGREFGLPTVTVEAWPRFYHYSRWRLRRFPNVTVRSGDSADTIARVAGEGELPGPVFAYLDAHGPGNLPLLRELDALSAGWSDWVAVVDDFRVPDDPGYGFEQYGEGLTLDLDLLRLDERPGIAVFWPDVPSSREGGSRKGYVILAAGRLREEVARLDVVRPHGSAVSGTGED